MRITFVIPEASFAGGIKVVATYAERLQKRGHTVAVIGRAPHFVTIRDRLRALVSERRWLPSTPVGSHFDGRRIDLREIESRRPVAESDVPDADVVIATFWSTANWISTFPPTKGAKVLFIQGYEVLPGESVPEIDATWRLPFQKIVISRWLRDLAASRFSDSDTLHVPNSVDLDQFHAPPRSMNSVPAVGFLSHSSPFKGMNVALAAVEKTRRQVPNLRIVSFGTERPAGALTLPPGSEFHLLPRQSFIREIYAKCDVWLCASRREGFHLPPLEAMACRCPVVSTRVGGPEDVVEPGVNGHLVDVDDADALSSAVVKVLAGGPEAWRRMSDAAFATATRYTWDDAAERFEAALNTAVRRAKAGEIA